MPGKTLSIFIDESGDFGAYEPHAPYYLVTMVLHDQNDDISESIYKLDAHLQNLNYNAHAIHTGPLIRRESIYSQEQIQVRKKLFNSLFHFARKIKFHYLCIQVSKKDCSNITLLTSKLSKKIFQTLQQHVCYFNQFESIVIYYDNGQVELTRILTGIFTPLFSQVEFRKVLPVDYKLFQVADLICTLELLNQKASSNAFSHSEMKFFSSIREFKKKYVKPIQKKRLPL